MENNVNPPSVIADSSNKTAADNNINGLAQLSVVDESAKLVKEKNDLMQPSIVVDSTKETTESNGSTKADVADDVTKAELENETNALLSVVADELAAVKAAEEYRKARQLSERRTHHEHSWDDNLDDVQIPDAAKSPIDVNTVPPRSYFKFTLVATLIVMPLSVVALIFFLLWTFYPYV